MTYGEIKERVTSITHTERSVLSRFAELCKLGIADIISNFPVCKAEHCYLYESVIDICKLTRPCFDVRAVRTAAGKDIPFKVLTASQLIDVPYWVRECFVFYRYIPYCMSDYNESPDIPKELHELLFLYITAKEKELIRDADAEAALMLYEKTRDGMADKYRENFLIYE